MTFPLPGEMPSYQKKDIKHLIENLDIDPLKNSGIPVVHPVGNGSSGVFIIGEAPGAKEEELGEPFVGASGKFLNNTLLPSIGLNRNNIYLTNIVKCRPPKNRDPFPEEKVAWSPILLAEIIAYKPKVIVCLGRHSMGFFFPDAKISSVHGKQINIKLYKEYEQIVIPLYHPAVALYNPNMREVLVEDFLKVKDYIDNKNLNSDDSSNDTLF